MEEKGLLPCSKDTLVVVRREEERKVEYHAHYCLLDLSQKLFCTCDWVFPIYIFPCDGQMRLGYLRAITL
jgi:hypothetical protein